MAHIGVALSHWLALKIVIDQQAMCVTVCVSRALSADMPPQDSPSNLEQPPTLLPVDHISHQSEEASESQDPAAVMESMMSAADSPPSSSSAFEEEVTAAMMEEHVTQEPVLITPQRGDEGEDFEEEAVEGATAVIATTDNDMTHSGEEAVSLA